MSKFELYGSGDMLSRTPAIARQSSHPHLSKFKEAKKELGIIYENIHSFMNDCYSFTDAQMHEERFARILNEGTHQDVCNHLNKIKGIQTVISRNQMKCAFFGRTSNGKSTVINAMLGSRLLPSGLGHTTSCFLEIQGTDQTAGYLTIQGTESQVSDTSTFGSRPIESVGQLAHAVSGANLSSDSLIRIYWPSVYCRLLREDVVLLDSPGINVDPDMDNWIDSYCLDADVFVLVANAESTLMQAEKDFFHRVSQKLSKPNIFILNNRWDASANESEYVEEVRAQHMHRCVAFLVDELKVCSRDEAEEHVFFVSAREALLMRSKATGSGTPGTNGPPGAASNFGSPLPTMGYMADGWNDRLQEFTNFEGIFEKILSESATRTKFASHCDQGKQISEHFRVVMEKVYETSVEEKDAAVRLRCLSQTHLEEIRSRLIKTSQILDEMLHTCLARVEAQVASALNAEIRRLGEVVGAYQQAFTSDPAGIMLYKRELNRHVERQLGRNIADACASDISNEVARSEQIMMSKLAAIVTDEVAKNRILQLVDPISFTPEFHVDCRNLCADFREDIRFRFSLGLGAIFQRMALGRNHTGYSPWSMLANSSALSSPSTGLSPTSMASSIDLFPSVMNRNSVGAAIVLGIVSKAVGWRVLGLVVGLYSGLYLYERLTWTNKAKESAFKRQYVDFASHKLRLIVDLTSNNARHQVKRELSMAQKKLVSEVELFSATQTSELQQLDSDINRLETITGSAKKLKNRAGSLLANLNSFHEIFMGNLRMDVL